MATVSKGRTFVSGETVTPAKLNELVDNATVTAIQAADISDAQITTAKIADANVTTAKIADANVTTAKIADANVTTAKIADSAVTTAKIANASITPSKLSQPYTLATAQNSTSGTAIDFTGIPSWARRITVMFNGVSKSGTSSILVQLGTSSGTVSSGYTSTGNGYNNANGTAGVSSSSGFVLFASLASDTTYGTMSVCNVSSNNWIASHAGMANSGTAVNGGGGVSLSGTLDRVRITTVNGTDTFDAGSINIAYEG